MTFNIRYPNPGDGFNFWPNRKDIAASMIRYHEADLIGVQEAFRSQLDDLTALLPAYQWHGVCRTDGTKAPDPDGEFSAILYRADRFELLEGSTFWLSETPDEVGVAGWDAALPSIVTWARFRDKQSGKTFFHFNTHFDHRGREARRQSAILIRKKIREIAGDSPVVLTGDFNTTPTDPPYRELTDDQREDHLLDALYQSRQPHHGPMSTWTNSFQFPGVPDRRIDYIFVKNKLEVLKHATLSDSWSGRLPSDHLPVIARVMVSE
jgi:endonuclease/exonuclease/phosphatase family metal-dependent hydrolase